MSSRNVDVAIRYLIAVTEQGLKAAVALTADLGKQSTVAQGAVDASMKAVQTQYDALAKVASRADQTVAKAAIDASTAVNKALDSQIAKMREAGSSYAGIIAKQADLKASSAELAASIRRSAEQEIASMRAVRAEADRTVRQRLTGFTGRAAGFAGTAASAAGGLALGGLTLGGGLAIAGLEKSRGVIEGTLAIGGATGLSRQQALALATIATSLGIAPRSIGQAFGTLGAQSSQFLAGGAKATADFGALGISQSIVRANQNNPLALFDLVTEQAAKLPATQRAAVQRSLLGRGSSIVGQLTAGGPLAGSVAQVEQDIPGLDPKKLIAMQEAFVHLKEVTTAFELSFAQAFGPAIGQALSAVIPLLKPIAMGFQDAFGVIKKFVDGPTGQAIGRFVVNVADAGKKLVEAFKPAQPFFANVLLPLVKGFAEGLAIGLLGAINLVTAAVKILAPVFGALGTVLAPLKMVIEDVGKVLGVVFGGDALGLIAKGFGAVIGEVPLLGKMLELLLRPVELVGSGISGLWRTVGDAFGKILGFIPGVGSKIGGLLGDVASTIVAAFVAIPDAITGVFSGLGDIIGKALVGAVNTAIDVINGGASILNAGLGLIGVSIPQLQHLTIGGGAASTGPNTTVAGGVGRGARPFSTGGLVPSMVSPGEQIIYGNHAMTVPGTPTAADNVFAMLPPGAAVMTSHGQALMAAGASMGDALAAQLPHFVAGGKVGPVNPGLLIAPKAAAGSKATPRFLHNVLIGNFTTAGWHAYLLAHPTTAPKGFSFSGPASTFGPPLEAAGSTAYGGSSSQPGIALNPHGGSAWNDALAQSLAGKAFRIMGAAGHSAVLKVIDKGPSAIGSHGPRKIDITGAGVRAMGLNPATFPTDSIFTATEVVGGVASPVTAASLAKQTPTLSNAVASLTGQTAFAGGFQAGLQGNTLMDTLRSGVLSSVISDVAINQLSSPGALNISRAANIASGAISGKPYGALRLGRVDQGVDFGGSGPVGAIGAGTVLRNTIWPGWPGTGGAVYSTGGRNVYVMEDFAPSVKVGQKIAAGQIIGRATGGSTGIETGWANSAGTGPLTPYNGRPDGTPMSGGLSFRAALGYRAGGVVGKGVRFTPTRRPRVDPLTAPLSAVGSLLGQSDATDVSSLIGLLASELDDVHAETLQSLMALASSLSRHSVKGLDPIQQRRLSSALNLVDAAIGNRIGLAVAGAQATVDAVARGNAHAVARATLAGVDPSSSGGLALAAALDKQTVQALNAQIGALNQALASAKKFGDKATIKTVTDQLNAALGNLDNALVQSLNDRKAAVEKSAQDAVDAASQAVSVAQAGEGILTLQQQLAGTDQTPAAGAQTADYIRRTVLPALQAQLQAQKADQAAAASVGDTARVNADILAELQTQTTILSESKTAQDAIKQNTQPLKQFGGQLALQFHGENLVDRIPSLLVGG